MCIDKAISTCPMFEGVSLERARASLKHAQLRTLEAGEILIDEGVPNEYLHLVVSGTLRVMRPLNDNRTHPVHLADLGRGAVVGEYSAFDKRAASARVSAVEQTRLLSQRASDFAAVLDEDPATAKQVYRNLLELLISRIGANEAMSEPIIPC